MNNFFEQLKNETQRIRLSRKEREGMRLALERSMTSARGVKSPVRITPSPLIFLAPRLISSLAFALVLAVGVGTSYAAEGALPGDLLYSVKVSVNEPVRAALAVSKEAKAEVHASLAERRLEEAQTLAGRGTLTTTLKQTLEANFEEHAAEVEMIAAAVEESDPASAADISARFGSAVEAHGSVIAKLGEEGDEENRRESENLSHALKDRGKRIARGDTPRALKAVAARVTETAPSTEDASMAFSMELPADDADMIVAKRIERTASTTLQEAERYLDTLKNKLDATTSARTKAQLSKLRTFISQLHTEEKNTFGRESAERALKDAVKVKAFIKAQVQFEDRDLLPAPEDEDEDENKGNEKDRDEGNKVDD